MAKSKGKNKFKTRTTADSGSVAAQGSGTGSGSKTKFEKRGVTTPKVVSKASWDVSNLFAGVTLAIIGLATYFTGLAGQFQGDDIGQIVQNVTLKSLGNIPLFFSGSTFYNGGGLGPLSGVYYRPLMTTIYSFIDVLFGPTPAWFHLVQLALVIGSAFLLFLVFRYSFSSLMSLFLAAIFLVHPLNSEIAFSIPALQDALFFFFGILALYLLLRNSSVKSLWAVGGCLFLSLLSKETGAVFIILSVLYLFWFNRERLKSFAGIIALPVVIYVLLRIHAVGLVAVKHIAPIDQLNLGGRLLTAPSILALYITKLLLPIHLSSGYYWTYQRLSASHFLLPALLDLAVIGLFVYLGSLVKHKLPSQYFLTFLFFAAWTVLGLLPYLQIIPLDMTASETWFYCSMAGLLGMIGVSVKAFGLRVTRSMLAPVVALIVVFAIGTCLRGLDWKTPNSLAQRDIAASTDNFIAYATIASSYIQQKNYPEAEQYATDSTIVYPNTNGYTSLGQAYLLSGNYPAAYTSLHKGLVYDNGYLPIYEMLCQLTLVYGSPNANLQFLLHANKVFPNNSYVWLYLAFLEYRAGNLPNAKTAIANAENEGSAPQGMYDNIVNGQPFTVGLGSKTYLVKYNSF